MLVVQAELILALFVVDEATSHERVVLELLHDLALLVGDLCDDLVGLASVARGGLAGLLSGVELALLQSWLGVSSSYLLLTVGLFVHVSWLLLLLLLLRALGESGSRTGHMLKLSGALLEWGARLLLGSSYLGRGRLGTSGL